MGEKDVKGGSRFCPSCGFPRASPQGAAAGQGGSGPLRPSGLPCCLTPGPDLRRRLERRRVRRAHGHREGAGGEGLPRAGQVPLGIRGTVPRLRGRRLRPLFRARLRVPGRGCPRRGADYPRTVFVTTSGSRTAPNLAPIVFELEQATYLFAALSRDAPLEDRSRRNGGRRRASVDQVDVPRVRRRE